MSQATRIAVDLAKSVFEIASDQPGKIAEHHRKRRLEHERRITHRSLR